MTRPLLILDLDETLIHGAESRLQRDADFMVGPFHIYKRPHLESFFDSIVQHFDVAIWSSASEDYVAGIAFVLSKYVPDWQFVWSRTRCVQRTDPEMMTTIFIKDLRKVKRRGYELDRVLMVDDTRHKVSRNYGNAIYIPAYEGEDDDAELPQLAKYVKSLLHEPNFRRIEKRGWRTKPL
ncbi:HAD family hydrolase [Rhodopirellula sp. JC740]|uniref:HAD family hydrolase n=2 Tax=Rhodopirellula halodulae TaxID=2894198 RepID=A0ABS8NFC3_9BACT|nr:HAD family hydrolase [Rhodopirellula sp. JC740]